MSELISLRSRLALHALTGATRLRARGRPWSYGGALIAAAAVGALTPGELRSGVMAAWELWDPADIGECTLMEWERHLLDRHVPPRSRLLIIGSGLGRDLVGYASLGHHVTGIEPAPIAARASLTTLRERGLDGCVIQGFAEDVEIEGTFDVAIFSYFCYGYIPVDERRIALLKKLRPYVADGGSVVLTYNGRQRFTLAPLTRLAAWMCGSPWRPTAGDVVYLTGRVAAPFVTEHLFEDEEIAEEAMRAGYQAEIHGAVGEVRLALLRPHS